MKLKRVPYSGSTDSRIVDAKSGEDIGRISGTRGDGGDGGVIAYPDDTAKKIVRAVNGRKHLIRQLDEYEEVLEKRQADMKRMTAIDLTGVSRNSDRVFTHIRFDDYDLRELFKEEHDGVTYLGNWLEFGECVVTNDRRTSYIGGRIRSGITDWEHDTSYVVRIELIAPTFKFMEGHVAHFEAHITPVPKDILIYPADWTPEKDESFATCDHCDKPHPMIEKFVPPVYEFAHVVAGKRIDISIGPRWSALEKMVTKDKVLEEVSSYADGVGQLDGSELLTRLFPEDDE